MSARQPAEQITDRAKRYRANSDYDGPMLCAFCGATSDLMVDHLDGFEENGEPENLILLCRSCNGRKSAVFAKADIGRRTDQYNPFNGFLSGIFGSKETYRVHGAAHPEEKRRRAEEKRLKAQQEREARQRERVEEREERAEARREKASEREQKRLEAVKSVARYKGVTIYRRGDGVIYASIDPASHYESVRDAKRVIDHFKNPASSLGHWTSAVDILTGELPATAHQVRQAARTVRSTPPGRRLAFLEKWNENPSKKRTTGVPTFEQYRWALYNHERGPYLGKGKFGPGAHDEGGAVIHATPKALRKEYAARIGAFKSGRGGGRDEVPF